MSTSIHLATSFHRFPLVFVVLLPLPCWTEAAEQESEMPPLQQASANLISPTSDSPEPTRSPKEEAYQRLLDELQKLELAFSAISDLDEQTKLTLQKADLLERLAELAPTAEERSSWLQHSVDMLSAAIQSGTCPEASKRLGALLHRLRAGGRDQDLVAYIHFEQLSAEYIQALQGPDPDYEKIQADWSANLEKYIGEYGNAPPVADAMLQLAITHEYSDEVDKAKHWYSRLAREFNATCAGKKAAGAIVRLESPGKELAITGSDLSGRDVQLDEYRGKVVLLHYWATWSDFCKKDIVVLKELAAKHGASGFQILSINVDHSREDVTGYVEKNSISWPQIFEEGGLESRLARQLGIVNVPTMLLIDKQGKVVNRDIQVADLGQELERLK